MTKVIEKTPLIIPAIMGMVKNLCEARISERRVVSVINKNKGRARYNVAKLACRLSFVKWEIPEKTRTGLMANINNIIKAIVKYNNTKKFRNRIAWSSFS